MQHLKQNPFSDIGQKLYSVKRQNCWRRRGSLERERFVNININIKGQTKLKSNMMLGISLNCAKVIFEIVHLKSIESLETLCH